MRRVGVCPDDGSEESEATTVSRGRKACHAIQKRGKKRRHNVSNNHGHNDKDKDNGRS